MEIKSMVEGYREELLEKLGKLVAVKSEEGNSTETAPFGEGPKEALETALNILAEDGFKTVNLDNYAGYAEIGEGEEVIGIIGHLDVVPANKEDGWDSDPYEMVEKDGTVYGRGVADDKGAVVASMIAMKVLRDLNIPLKKRIRLIMGTNEESGSKCLEYYVKKEGHVDYGFTPDGEFPGVFGEKGMIAMTYSSKETSIRDIKGGTAKNVVCPSCTITVDKANFSRKKLEDEFKNNDYHYEIVEKGDLVDITLDGVAAHASMPELGMNAISYLLEALRQAGFQDKFVEFYHEHFGLTTDGSGIGAKCEDEYGALTLNNGVISMEDGVITGSVDIRFPVTLTGKKVLKMMDGHLDDENGHIEVNGVVEPLYFALDTPLVKSLLSAYQEVTGDYETEPMTMGGGTYAKGINNTIAFGCAFLGTDYHIHNVNEFVPIDELLKQAEIYTVALMKLLEL